MLIIYDVEILNRLRELFIKGARFLIWDFEEDRAIAVNRIPKGSSIHTQQSGLGAPCWNFTETVLFYDIEIDLLRGIEDKSFVIPIIQILEAHPTHVTGYAVAYRKKGATDTLWEYSPVFTSKRVAEINATTMQFYEETKVVRAETDYYDVEEE